MVIKEKSDGFTLIELSIVIVIIGLIVAGVVGGQTLVKQAKLRSIVSEQQATKLALNEFKLEYDAVPGDFNNAMAYWTGANGCNAAGTGASVLAECNGDGDKRIENVAIGGAWEAYMAWKHLQLADLHPGSFFPGALEVVAVSDFNVKIPASRYNGVGITMVYDDATSDATAGDNATSGGRDLDKNVLVFGGLTAGMANGTVFESKDIKGIDDKVDDGAPTTGTVVGVGGTAAAGAGGTNCIDTTTPPTYNLDGTATPCAVAFTL